MQSSKNSHGCKKTAMRAIILAAGQGNVMDGMIKCLIRHPLDGKTILEHAIAAFAGMRITVVVGYRAVEIIQTFPQLDYVFNEEWAVTNSAYSLGLALDDTPCFVASGDLLFTNSLVRTMGQGPDNLALSSPRENRGLTAINCVCSKNVLRETYMGPLRAPDHDELIGLYKISSPLLLRRWKELSLQHSNLFNGQTLPASEKNAPIHRMRLPEEEPFHEINTVADYLRLFGRRV